VFRADFLFLLRILRKFVVPENVPDKNKDMAIGFFLNDTRKDSTNIDIVVRFKGRRYKRSTHITVPLAYWVLGTQRCSESVGKFPEGIEYNKSLKKQKEATEKAVAQFVGEMIVPTQEQFWNRVDELMHGERKSAGGFTAYFEKYINRREKEWTASTAKAARSPLHIIKEYQRQTGRIIMFKDINQDFYDDIRRYLFSQTHGKDNRPYSNNYFGRIIKTIKVVFNDARRNGAHRFDMPTNFKIDNYVADTVYLTPPELDAILAVELSGAASVARAKFIIGAYTGLRVSDFNSLQNVNVGEKYITITAKKTGQKIIAPINSRVRELIDTVDVFALLSDQYINRTIKEIARAAGIIEPIEVVKYIAGKRVHSVFEKCDLVSSHTARRSFATNAYKAGVPTIAIMKITGHTTEKSFLRYIKISKEENAELLAEHPFFK
jgi:integrase